MACDKCQRLLVENAKLSQDIQAIARRNRSLQEEASHNHTLAQELTEEVAKLAVRHKEEVNAALEEGYQACCGRG